MKVSDYLKELPAETDVDIWVLDIQDVAYLYNFGIAGMLAADPTSDNLVFVSSEFRDTTYCEIIAMRNHSKENT